MKRALLLDRDGVINRRPREGEYITRWQEVEFLPGVPEAIQAAKRADFAVIVVTNQRCVAKELITAAELEALHRRMCDSLASAGAVIDAIYYCPHDLQPACNCRKPAPGMLLTAAHEHRLDLSKSWMVGDSEVDIAAARNAGCKAARLLSPGEKADQRAEVTTTTLFEAVQVVLRTVTAGGVETQAPAPRGAPASPMSSRVPCS